MLEDLLEHEVLVATLLDRSEVPCDLVDPPIHLGAPKLVCPVSVRLEHRIVAVVEVHDIFGLADDRRRVGPSEHLTVPAYPDQ